MKLPYPVIQCADGAQVSVQASRSHYSSPRSDVGPYTHVVAEFPSVSPPDSWHQYAEPLWSAEDDLEQCIYPYLPVELAREFVEAHGGEMNWRNGARLSFLALTLESPTLFVIELNRGRDISEDAYFVNRVEFQDEGQMLAFKTDLGTHATDDVLSDALEKENLRPYGAQLVEIFSFYDVDFNSVICHLARHGYGYGEPVLWRCCTINALRLYHRHKLRATQEAMARLSDVQRRAVLIRDKQREAEKPPTRSGGLEL